MENTNLFTNVTDIRYVSVGNEIECIGEKSLFIHTRLGEKSRELVFYLTEPDIEFENINENNAKIKLVEIPTYQYFYWKDIQALLKDTIYTELKHITNLYQISSLHFTASFSEQLHLLPEKQSKFGEEKGFYYEFNRPKPTFMSNIDSKNEEELSELVTMIEKDFGSENKQEVLFPIRNCMKVVNYEAK